MMPRPSGPPKPRKPSASSVKEGQLCFSLPCIYTLGEWEAAAGGDPEGSPMPNAGQRGWPPTPAWGNQGVTGLLGAGRGRGGGPGPVKAQSLAATFL